MTRNPVTQTSAEYELRCRFPDVSQEEMHRILFRAFENRAMCGASRYVRMVKKVIVNHCWIRFVHSAEPVLETWQKEIDRKYQGCSSMGT